MSTLSKVLAPLLVCGVLGVATRDLRPPRPVPADAPKRPTKTQLNAKKPSPETLAQIDWWEEFERGDGAREIVLSFSADGSDRMDRVAEMGLRYTNMHSTALCSPTRQALLTGRNPHATGIGAVMNSADSRPGYSGYHTKDTATIAEVLRENGYSTAMFGKWHQTPDWELSPSGPFDRWPTGEGFEKFYGFQGGETDQFEPSLSDGTTPVMRPAGKGYHLTQDLVDHSINWIRTQKSVTPNKPFFLYLATGGTHAPIQVPQEYIDRYKGKFDQGWDKLREEIFAREKKLGVIPKDTRLTNNQLKLWKFFNNRAMKKARKRLGA